MIRKFHLKTVILGASILLLFAYIGGVLIARERLADLRNELEVQISEQRTLLVAIAEKTASNGADKVTEDIIKDCSVAERIEFDSLLGKLDSGLIRTDLVTLERLFGRCGTFYSSRKSVMVARLEREIEVYESLVIQLSNIDGRKIDSYLVSEWKSLAEAESRQSDQFSALVSHQDRIIKSLIEGKNLKSEEMKEILSLVKETQKELQETGYEVGERRKAVISL